MQLNFASSNSVIPSSLYTILHLTFKLRYSLHRASPTLAESNLTMFRPTLARRLAQTAKEQLSKNTPLTVANNPYKARKVWPPDFKELTHQQQLRFEKKYKRRIALANYSPRWDKGVKYAQLLTIAGQFSRFARCMI